MKYTSVTKICGNSKDDFFAIHKMSNGDQVGYLARFRKGEWQPILYVFDGWPMKVDRHNNLWFSQADVLIRVDDKNSWKMYPLPSPFGWNSGIYKIESDGKDGMYLYAVDGEKVQGYLCKFHGDTIEILHCLGKKGIKAMARRPNGDLYFSGKESKLNFWNGIKIGEIETGIKVGRNGIPNLYFDESDRCYLGTSKGELYYGKFDGQGKITFEMEKRLKSEMGLFDIAFDKKGGLYIADHSCFRIDDKAVEKIDGTVNSLLDLPEGPLLGTERKGVVRADGTFAYPLLELSQEEEKDLLQKRNEMPSWEQRNLK